MRRVACLLLVAACGPKPAPVVTPPPEEPPPERTPPPTVVWFTTDGREMMPIACAGGPDGVWGGVACLDPLELGGERGGCKDAMGTARIIVKPEDEHGWTVFHQPGAPPGDDPRDKRVHEDHDLDGDGEREKIELVPHDNRASYGRSLTITDGHDPLMSDSYDPFPESADLQLLGTADADGDGRRELILYAPDEEGYGVAVLEYWASAEAYRLDCRNP